MIDHVSIRERLTEDDDDRSLRAAVYARTSSTSREHGYSLDAQVDRSVDHCQTLGWTVSFIYRDEAVSGKDTDRPMFQKMLSMAKKQAFDVIVFWKLDRFSRSLMHAVQLESKLRDHDVYLYSVTEQIDTTSATGRFNFRNLASAAEFERDMIKQRTQIGLNGLAEEHKWPNNNPPLGYSLTSENRLSVDEKESNLVTDIFELYIELRSMPDVASQLNQRGHRTTDGGEWTPRAVGDVLRNQIYRGTYELGDISEYVPEYQIVDGEIFERVTEIRMRFQRGQASRSTMTTSRKEQTIAEMREMYKEYLQSCS
jgi:site-specific DNA recombinase